MKCQFLPEIDLMFIDCVLHSKLEIFFLYKNYKNTNTKYNIGCLSVSSYVPCDLEDRWTVQIVLFKKYTYYSKSYERLYTPLS